MTASASVGSMVQKSWSAVAEILKSISTPQFAARTYDVTTMGAVSDGTTDCLPAIARAIAKCSEDGGGRVVIPAGKFFCKGPIHLKSNVDLHLDEGCEVIFSHDERDYLPVVFTRWEGTEVFNFSPQIYGYKLRNVAITGKGTFNGNASKNFARWKPSQYPDQRALREMGGKVVPLEERIFGQGHRLRPAMCQPVECDGVLIEGVKFIDSPFWVIHPVYCNNVTVRSVTVESYNENSDGCDPESSTNVLIEDCVFRTGDDGIAIKSGRDADGRRIDRPTENVVIRNCTFHSRTNGVCIGSEISGGVRNVFVENVYIEEASHGIYFKSNLDRGGYIEDIAVRNVKAGNIHRSVIKFEPDYKSESSSHNPTRFSGFLIENVTCAKSAISGIDIAGFADMPVEGVTLRNIRIDSSPIPVNVRNAIDVSIERTTVAGKSVRFKVR